MDPQETKNKLNHDNKAPSYKEAKFLLPICVICDANETAPPACQQATSEPPPPPPSDELRLQAAAWSLVDATTGLELESGSASFADSAGSFKKFIQQVSSSNPRVSSSTKAATANTVTLDRRQALRRLLDSRAGTAVVAPTYPPGGGQVEGAPVGPI